MKVNALLTRTNRVIQILATKDGIPAHVHMSADYPGVWPITQLLHSFGMKQPPSNEMKSAARDLG